VFCNLRVPGLIAGLRQPPGLLTLDPAQNRESERKLSALEPATVGFGHGPVIEDGGASQLGSFIHGLSES
jgi:hypothetical protein